MPTRNEAARQGPARATATRQRCATDSIKPFVIRDLHEHSTRFWIPLGNRPRRRTSSFRVKVLAPGTDSAIMQGCRVREVSSRYWDPDGLRRLDEAHECRRAGLYRRGSSRRPSSVPGRHHPECPLFVAHTPDGSCRGKPLDNLIGARPRILGRNHGLEALITQARAVGIGDVAPDPPEEIQDLVSQLDDKEQVDQQPA